MKKKTFIVQLLDSKQPSRTSFTQVEDANFYSNDTDASLVFIPHEEDFNFETAKVVMYNRGDESLVERDAVVTTENGRKVASYELPAEIIAHWGDWTAQPVFTSGGEIYSGAIVPFSVIRYLMHERPATLTEIVTVTEFIQQSQALVDDMEQAEAQRANAESSRLSAETQRLSNETVRVSAEEQRKTDHANRSAELDGKADKVVLKNSVANGDFSDGLTGWSNMNDRLNVELKEGYVRVESFDEHSTNARLVANLLDKNSVNDTDVFYIQMVVNTNVANAVYLGDGNVPIPTGTVEPNRKVTISTLYTPVWKQPSFRFMKSATTDVYSLQWINLTQTFGVGNEPTKKEMDELIKVTGYIDSENGVNVKEMLGYLMAGKANKKQEDWITPTFLNGSTGNMQFRKNQFGRVEFRGSVTGSESGSVLMLPLGYRPRTTSNILVKTSGGGIESRNVIIQNSGGVYFAQPYGTHTVYFDTMSFSAN